MEGAELVELAFQAMLDEKDDETKQSYYQRLSKNIATYSYLSNDELYGRIDKSMFEDLNSRIYLSKIAETEDKPDGNSSTDGKTPASERSQKRAKSGHLKAARSRADGDCLFSSVSMALVGDNRMISTLRVLTGLELYLNASFYSDHQANILPLCVSHAALDSGLRGEDLVQKEATLICVEKSWARFLCILAVASVINRNILSFYSDFGDCRFQALFNCIIHPRLPCNIQEPIRILFCYAGIVNSGVHCAPNHYVPLFRSPLLGKRKATTPGTAGVIKTKRTTASAQTKLPFITQASQSDLISSVIPTKRTVQTTLTLTEKSSKPSFNSSSCTKVIDITSNVSSHVTVSHNDVPLSSPTFEKPSGGLNEAPKVVTRVEGRRKYDIDNFVGKGASLSEAEIEDIIKNVYKPDINYAFPKRNNRHFKYSYFKGNPWLCYSPSLDGAFCLSCVLFGHKFPEKSKAMKRFYTEPFINYNDVCVRMKKHEGVANSGSKACLHSHTIDILLSILNKSGRIFEGAVEKSESENIIKIRPLIDCVKFCGRNGISLRGHRDDSNHHPKPGEYAREPVGNFIELVNFRIRAGDTALKAHLETCAGDASYLSKSSQNQLIRFCGEVISEHIVNSVRQNRFYSIIADECLDCSKQEQLSLVLRYVDDKCMVREEFVGFFRCKYGLTGANIARSIKEADADLGLDLDDCRGQGYDGASTMAGCFNGVSAKILEVNRKALYFHCHSHRLNLMICQTCSIPLVKNILEQMTCISNLFNISENRQKMLVTNILKHARKSQRMRLKAVCTTRWVERIEALDLFEELFVPIFYTLEEMSFNVDNVCNAVTSSKATSFLAIVSSFQFIVVLVMTRTIFDRAKEATKLLQSKTNDVMNAIDIIQALKNYVRLARNTVDKLHDRWFKEAIALGEQVNIPVAVKRTANRQMNRNNPPSNNACEYYKLTVTIPIFDHLNTELARKFTDDCTNVYYGLSIIPAQMHLMSTNPTSKLTWRESFLRFAAFYAEDLPMFKALEGEMDMWEQYWGKQNSSCLPDGPLATLAMLNCNCFDNIKVSLRILATVPSTSCEAERTFSTMRRLKTYTRSTMTEDRLTGLALMQVHQEIEPDVEKVIVKFCAEKRRLKF